MQYEANASHLNRLIRAERVQGMTFGQHLHYSFEFFYVNEGELSCTVENETYTLQAGDGVLVLPNQSHSYHTPEFSDAIMLIFDPIYVNEFYKFINDKEFVNPVFRPNEPKLFSLPEPKDVFGWKSVLYALCAQASAQCELQPSSHKNNHLIEKVIEYISQNLDGTLRLEQLAENLGYSYHYLSNCIKDNFGMNFCTLVNQYRVDLAASLLRTTDLTITEVAARSGFSTIRSFNRAFKNLQGITPSEFVGTNK